MDIVRLVTVHPIFVHFTLGGVPLFIAAYIVARWKKSERWTFVGDVVLALTVAVSLLTVAFGLVSNWTLLWPGGLGLWRWLHFGLGLALGVLLLIMGGIRLRGWRRRQMQTSSGVVALAAVIGIVALVNGWIGGEVLVYRGGMAVVAAGDGAMAQPIRARAPSSFEGAMAEMRGAWAAASVHARVMMVHHPHADDFGIAADSADRLVELASWLEKEGPEVMKAHLREHGQPDAEVPSEAITSMARSLQRPGQAMAQAARDQELTSLLSATSQLETACTGCHQTTRWNH